MTKRSLLSLTILVTALLAAPSWLHAEESDDASLVIRPSAMKDGETKLFEDHGKKITVQRNGDVINIEVQGAEQTRKLTIVSTGDRDILIQPDSDRRHRIQVLGPGNARILMDGLPRMKKLEASEHWFICPKDNTMLRVPEGKENATYRCPVDGTVLEKKQGRGFTIWWGEGFFEGQRL